MPIGAVTTLGVVVGMLAVTPAGALVEATSHKRACVIVVCLGAVVGAAVSLRARNAAKWEFGRQEARVCARLRVSPALSLRSRGTPVTY